MTETQRRWFHVLSAAGLLLAGSGDVVRTRVDAGLRTVWIHVGAGAGQGPAGRRMEALAHGICNPEVRAPHSRLPECSARGCDPQLGILDRRVRTVPASRSRSLGKSARTSPSRRPPRQPSASIARLRMPVGARPEQARRRDFTSSAVRISTGRVARVGADLLDSLVEARFSVLSTLYG